AFWRALGTQLNRQHRGHGFGGQEDSMTRVDSLNSVSSGMLWACFVAVLAPAIAPAQEAPPRPFLRKVIQLNDAQLVAVARNVRQFKKVPQIPEIGHFSTPAKIEDLAGLTHPPDDIAALKRCKPGSCDVKIGTKALEAISKVDWKAPDAEKHATLIFNQAIVDYVTAYQ